MVAEAAASAGEDVAAGRCRWAGAAVSVVAAGSTVALRVGAVSEATAVA